MNKLHPSASEVDTSILKVLGGPLFSSEEQKCQSERLWSTVRDRRMGECAHM